MNKSHLRHIYSNAALVSTAAICGLSFVAQKSGMAFVGPFTFNSLRMSLGALCLLPLISLFKILSIRTDERTSVIKRKQRMLLLRGGFVCGLMLFFALSVNQYCMIYAPAGKAGFITSLYIVFVPIFSLFLGKKLTQNVKISILLAIVGLYMLCYKAGSSIAASDIFLLVSSVFFALHIMCVGHYSRHIDSIKLSCVQFFVVFIFSMPLMLIFETPTLQALIAGAKPILFSGIVVTGIAYTLQIFGQRNTNPVLTALIMSSESIFAVIGGTLLLGESLSMKEGIGCVIIIFAIILAQLKIGGSVPVKLYGKTELNN